ncbi:MAG TPA: hypothetical protein VEQ34_05950 [Pyrinomonadaceae bacterium]|nr:hypothetical protein [Pyrinomonadaceae bacterium]
MKKIFVILILTLLSGSLWQASAQTNQQIKLRVNNQKAVAGSKLTIKFVSIVEESRCPEGVNCIHAGNAKIQIKVTKRGGAAKTFELNTNFDPNGISFEGYEIKLANLEPVPKENIRINRNGYTATLIVSKSRNSK